MSSLTVDNLITIPGAPAIPGLIFRRFRGEEDFPKMVAVIDASAKADQLERVSTVEEVRNAYAHLVNSVPERDMVMVEAGDELVGYSRIWWRDEKVGDRLYGQFIFFKPDWRGKGIRRAIMHYHMEQIRQMAAAQTDFTGPRFVEIFSDDGTGTFDRMLLEEGFELAAQFAMAVRPDLENLPEPHLPEGFEVRPVTPDQYRAIWEADVEASQDHFGSAEVSEDTYQEWLGFPWFDPSMWKIAWHIETNQVAGQVKSFIDEELNAAYGYKRGWTESICVGKPFRRRGLARALLEMSLHEVKARGMTEAALGFHTENQNKAYELYLDEGFKVVKLSSTYRKKLE